MQEIIRIDLNGVNCYLGKQDGNFILFDTGGHLILDKQFDNRYDTLLKKLTEHGCVPGKLKLIVLTHGDNDHVANASALREHFGAKIAMNEGDRALVENPDIEMVMKSFQYRGVVFRFVMFFMKNKIRKIMLKTLEDYEKFTPDIFLSSEDSLSEYGLKILHLPGHTPGSIAILTENGDLIIGDTLVNNGKPEIAPNAVDFNLLETSVKSIRKTTARTIFPGHGKPFDINEFL